MTKLNDDGLVISRQDLSTKSPGGQDDGRIYNHDGSSSITLVDGATTTNSGYYMWEDSDGAWNPMKATLTSAEGLFTNGKTAVVRDDTNALDVARFFEGGNVEVPNGQLSELGNRVATRVWATGSNIPHADLADAPASAHHSKYTDSEAQSAVSGASLSGGLTLGSDLNVSTSIFENTNRVATRPWATGSNILHSELADSPASAHHSKYTDSEAVSAVNSETSLSVDVSGDADTVDGYDIQKNGTDGAGIINFKT